MPKKEKMMLTRWVFAVIVLLLLCDNAATDASSSSSSADTDTDTDADVLGCHFQGAILPVGFSFPTCCFGEEDEFPVNLMRMMQGGSGVSTKERKCCGEAVCTAVTTESDDVDGSSSSEQPFLNLVLPEGCCLEQEDPNDLAPGCRSSSSSSSAFDDDDTTKIITWCQEDYDKNNQHTQHHQNGGPCLSWNYAGFHISNIDTCFRKPQATMYYNPDRYWHACPGTADEDNEDDPLWPVICENTVGWGHPAYACHAYANGEEDAAAIGSAVHEAKEKVDSYATVDATYIPKNPNLERFAIEACGFVQGPRQDQPPTPTPCEESVDDEFYLKLKKNGRVKSKTCGWLLAKKQKKKKIKRICKRDKGTFVIRPAKEVCPVTCSTCDD